LFFLIRRISAEKSHTKLRSPFFTSDGPHSSLLYVLAGESVNKRGRRSWRKGWWRGRAFLRSTTTWSRASSPAWSEPPCREGKERVTSVDSQFVQYLHWRRLQARTTGTTREGNMHGESRKRCRPTVDYWQSLQVFTSTSIGAGWLSLRQQRSLTETRLPLFGLRNCGALSATIRASSRSH